MFQTHTTQEIENNAPGGMLYELRGSKQVHTPHPVLCLKQKHYFWKNEIKCGKGMFLQKMVLIFPSFTHICSLMKIFLQSHNINITIRTISYAS